MKIIHFADLHFSEKHQVEAEKCLQHIINVARSENPDAIICSGDITDSQYLGMDTRSARTISRQFRELSDIAPVAVVRGTPSHDGNTPEILRNVSGRHPIHVSTEPEQIYLQGSQWWTTAMEPELVVTQIPAPTKKFWQNRQGIEQDNENIAQAMAAIFAGFGAMAGQYQAPHVLNGHFSMKGSKISETQTLPGSEISVSTDTLAMSRASMACLGHIHMSQAYTYRGGQAYHCGSIFRKNFGERTEVKGFYIHEHHGPLGWNSRFVETPARELVQVNVDLITDMVPDETLPDKILKLTEDLLVGAVSGAWVKVVITLWIDEIRRINQSEIKRTLEDAGAKVNLEITRVRRENSRDENILRAESLADKVRALAEHRSKPAPDGIWEMLEKIETLTAADLAKYARERLEQVEEKERKVA